VAASAPVKPLDTTPKIFPLSVEAYRSLGDMGLIPKNTELLYGQVYQKMSKSPLHSALVYRISKLLQTSLSPGQLLRTEQPITCGDSEPEPDFAVVHGNENDFWDQHPRTADLVIEICVTSHDYDRFKLAAYATAGVKEVWLILVTEKQIEVFAQPTGDRFSSRTAHGPSGKLTSAIVPSFSVDFARLFAK
jgi:Uma2 family endonuclease